MTPFVAKALALLEERKAAETPEEQRDVEERLAALIRSNYQTQKDDKCIVR